MTSFRQALSFALGLMVLAFLAGYQVHAWGIWPHPVLRDAKDAFRALKEAYLDPNYALVD